jgi:hypothetical protein
VIVSEETGKIAVAHNGRLIRGLDQDRLRRVLRTLMKLDREESKPAGSNGKFHLPTGDMVRTRRARRDSTVHDPVHHSAPGAN